MATFWDTPEESIDSSLFGPPAVKPAPPKDLEPGVHPRIAFNEEEWDAILTRYAKHYHSPNSWSYHQGTASLIRGPTSPFILRIADLDTSAYKGDQQDLSEWNEEERKSLEHLADEMSNIIDIDAQALFMCAFWGFVNNKIEAEHKFLKGDVIATCKRATISWAKVLLTHRAFNCASKCPSGKSAHRAYLWDHEKRFVVPSDSYTLGFSLALAYDVLYNSMSDSDRQTVRSAIAMLVFLKESWGNTKESTVGSPNADLDPHRIFSNWAPYHSALYLTNLAIEGETDFDEYTKSVLNSKQETGFNVGLDFRFTKMLDAYMTHSINPDGSTFEDGYTYFISMLQGSLGLIAVTRRGLDLVGTPRFRNFIHNAVQMTEPWHCGALVGHGAGGGILFPTYVALFRYVYPQGILPNMFWRNRMGHKFENDKPCRIDWYQHMMYFTVLAYDHDESISTAISPAELPLEIQKKLPLSFYAPRRGLVIMRNSWDENAAYVHFDARPDAFIAGHDNADRGVFTFAALRQMWLTDLPNWGRNLDSRKHSVMHVDGLAQGEFRAPSAQIIKTVDNGEVAIAAANMTYAYNVHWYQSPTTAIVRRSMVSYFSNGTETKVQAIWDKKEEGDPRSFGWPKDDDGADIGMARQGFKIWGDPDFGFNGLYIWKRNYRPEPEFLKRAIRSVALVRSNSGPGYLLVTDSFESLKKGFHTFESYLVLHDDVKASTEDSWCNGERCFIVLKSADGSKEMQIHAIARKKVHLTFRIEVFTTDFVHTRVIIKAVAKTKVELWLGLHALSTEVLTSFRMKETNREDDAMKVVYENDVRVFMVDKRRFVIKKVSRNFNSPMRAIDTKKKETRSRGLLGYIVSKMYTRRRFVAKVPFEKFSSDADTFFHQTDMTHQAVLVMTTEANLKRKQGKKYFEKLSLCTRGSELVLISSSIVVYDCGKNPALNYEKRFCQQIHEKRSTKQCRKRNAPGAPTLFFSTADLRPGRTFFVVVSIDLPQALTTLRKGKKFGNPVAGFWHRRIRRRIRR